MLPLSSDPQVNPRDPGMLSGRYILVVEDEYFLADDIARELKALGARIAGPAGELQEAMDLVDAHVAIDAAIVDINLREEMVFPLVRKLRGRGIPFLFASGYGTSAIEAEFRDARLFEKPLNIAAMIRELVFLLKPR